MSAELPAGGRYRRWGIAAARVAGKAARGGLFWAAVAVVLVIVLASRLAKVIGLQVRDAWHRLGVHGRLVSGMVLVWPEVIIASSLNLLPGGVPGMLIAGAAGDVFFAGWWKLWRWRGQRQWKALGAAKLGDGAEATAPMSIAVAPAGLHALEQRVGALEDRMGATERRGEEQAQRVSALATALTTAFAVAGLQPPEGIGGKHRLRLLHGEGTQAEPVQRHPARHRAARLSA